MRTYERFGEAVRVTLGTVAIAGLICLLLRIDDGPASDLSGPVD
jgi:hypothetical protein